MSEQAEYYVMKGLVSEMSAEDQAKVLAAEAAVIEIANQSDKAMIGALMAMMKLAAEIR